MGYRIKTEHIGVSADHPGLAGRSTVAGKAVTGDAAMPGIAHLPTDEGGGIGVA